MKGRFRIAAMVAAGATAVAVASAPQQVAGATTPAVPGARGPAVATEDDRAMRSELRALARAWADGGGTFGYPFWSKAAQRWRRGEITAAVFREYVTGYRDRLVLGCDLLDDVDTEIDPTDEVQALVADACRSRIEALREQQRALDASIQATIAGADADIEELETEMAEHEANAAEKLQESFRGTRLGMNLAQSRLERAGLAPLREDAFL